MKLRILALAVLLAGCTPVTAPTPPTPSTGSPSVSAATPTPTCTPAGGTPKACSPEELQQVRLNEETIALYKRWTKESNRLYRAGGTATVTDEMKATTAGEFQESAMADFQQMRRANVKWVAGEVVVVSIKADPTSSTAPGSATIRACIDGTTLRFQSGGKSVGVSGLAIEYVTAKPVDGVLKLFSVESEAVSKCPSV